MRVWHLSGLKTNHEQINFLKLMAIVPKTLHTHSQFLNVKFLFKNGIIIIWIKVILTDDLEQPLIQKKFIRLFYYEIPNSIHH